MTRPYNIAFKQNAKLQFMISRENTSPRGGSTVSFFLV